MDFARLHLGEQGVYPGHSGENLPESAPVCSNHPCSTHKRSRSVYIGPRPVTSPWKDSNTGHPLRSCLFARALTIQVTTHRFITLWSPRRLREPIWPMFSSPALPLDFSATLADTAALSAEIKLKSNIRKCFGGLVFGFISPVYLVVSSSCIGQRAEVFFQLPSDRLPLRKQRSANRQIARQPCQSSLTNCCPGLTCSGHASSSLGWTIPQLFASLSPTPRAGDGQERPPHSQLNGAFGTRVQLAAPVAL